MLKLNVNQEKQLNFEIQISGVQADQLSSFLRIEIDEIEYGFPAQVKQESVTVNLPALKTVVARKLKEGTEVNVKLEIIADGHHLIPWKDTFILSYPLVIEAKIIEDDSNSIPTFKTKLVTKSRSTKKVIQENKVIEPVNKINKEEVKNISEEGVYEYMARAGTKNEKIQKLIYEQAEIAAGTSVPVDVLKYVVKILKKKR
jgi:hypothetical protein